MKRRENLRHQFEHLSDLYRQCAQRDMLPPELDATIEQEFDALTGALAPHLADDRAEQRSPRIVERREQLRRKLETVITLFYAVERRSLFDAAMTALLRTELGALATQFGLSFLPNEEASPTPVIEPTVEPVEPQAEPVEPPVPVEPGAPRDDSETPLDTYQAPVPSDGKGPFSETTFERLLTPLFIATELKNAQEKHRADAATLEEYERSRVRAEAEGKLKEWDERHRKDYTALRSTVRSLSWKIERFLNDRLNAEEMTEIRQEIRHAFTAQNGHLTHAQHTVRLSALQKEAFREEAESEQFYPTPRPIVEKYVLPALNLTGNLSMLEPSAGKGDIADAVRSSCPSCGIDVIEFNETRQDILRLKGYNVVGTDTLTYHEHQYDRVVMNPPFDGNIGIEHIEYAYQHLLKPGGVLVAVAPASYATSTSNRHAIEFRRNYLEPYGTFVGIPVEEYNKEIERPITIHIAVITLTKPLIEEVAPAVEALAVSVGDILTDRVTWTTWRVTKQLGEGEALEYELTNERTGVVQWMRASLLAADQWVHTRKVVASDHRRTLVSRRAETRDSSFTPPEIVTARALYTHTPKEFHVDRSILNEQIKPYVIEGANYAIESLDANGGYLLADGTGTGKTLQQLLTAHHYVKTEKRPVLIITESDQIIQQSFFGDAVKLGLPTPDRIDISERPLPTPRRYKGLYQDCGLGDDDETTPDYATSYPAFKQGVVTVVRFRPGLAMRAPGIYVGTYHDLSGLRHLSTQLTAAQDALDRARKEKSAANARYTAMRKTTPPGISKKEWASEVKELQRNDPAYSRVIHAEDDLWQVEFDEMDRWIKGAACLIYDEAHNLKNTGRGGSLRARRAARLSESAKRVMFVTATPADKPGDTLYLRRSGLYENDEDYEEWMNEIGYYLTEERTNDRGEVIQRAEWKPYSDFGIAQALGGLRTLFDWMTDSRMMLKREIALSNLEPVQMIDVPVPHWINKYLLDVRSAIEEDAEFNDRSASTAEILMEQKRILEPFKIERCLELIDAELAEGRSVVVFADLVEEGTELKSWGRPKAGTLQVLRERLCVRYGNEIAVVAGVQGDYERFKRLSNIQEFQAGKRRVALCTIGSGGTGISLDDTLGNAPRTIVILTAPMNSIKSVQLIGRVVRANTKSRSRVKFLFADVAVDEWLKDILATKLKMLRAIVEGQVKQMTPEEIEKSETDAARSFSEERHSLWDASDWIAGERFPQQRPLRVRRLRDTLNRWWVQIKGRTRDDLERAHKEFASLFSAFGFERDSSQYEGTFYQAPYSDEAWNWLLNLLKPESSVVAATPDQLFTVGDTVLAARDITRGMIRSGTEGTVLKAQHYGEGWFYDVQWANGTTTSLVRQKHLSLRDLYRVQVNVGDRFIRFGKVTHAEDGTRSRIVMLVTVVGYNHEAERYKVIVTREKQQEGTPVTLKYGDPQDFKAENLTQQFSEPAAEGESGWLRYDPDDPRLQGEEFETEALADDEPSLQHEIEAEYTTLPTEKPTETPQPVEPDTTTPAEPTNWRLDNKKALPQGRTIKEIRSLKIQRRHLSERYEALFGRVPERSVYLAHGPAGHGKSTLALAFGQEIARQEAKKGKRVLYINSEQPSDRGGWTDRAERVDANGETLVVVDTRDPSDIDGLVRTGEYSFVFIDSVNRLDVRNNRELVQFLNALFIAHPTVSFFLIAHETKQGRYKGPSDLAHDAEIVVRVEKAIATTEKNHFGPHNSIRIFDWPQEKQSIGVRTP